MSSTHRRKVSGRNKAIGGVVAAAVIGGGALLFTGTAQAAGVGAAYTRTSDWSTGYTGQYVITNDSGQVKKDWTLEFDLPTGAKLSSLWNGRSEVSGRHVTVTPPSWDTDGLAAGKSVTIGFVVNGTADPSGCLIDDAKCSADGGATPEPSGRPSETAKPEPSATPTKSPSPSTSAPTTPAPTQTPGSGTSTDAGFAPYVDTSLYPAFDLVANAAATGVKDYNLAFVTDGGGCTPKWGGVTDLGSDAVAGQIGALRAKGGDVRVSFGGAAGSELATTCSSADALATAYGKVVDAYKLTKVDFDVEGGALPNTAANTRRAQAIAKLQKAHPGIDVSFMRADRPGPARALGQPARRRRPRRQDPRGGAGQPRGERGGAAAPVPGPAQRRAAVQLGLLRGPQGHTRHGHPLGQLAARREPGAPRPRPGDPPLPQLGRRPVDPRPAAHAGARPAQHGRFPEALHQALDRHADR
ncbi:cellulose binding domain-containing protein [Streptomyces sp. NPDC005568]|uniref:cellulose binding domain-containing protein n=1 Tax=Streptomyces sp. NPDC005568 TaxID=3156887 RepID=UPI0033A2B3D8